MAERQGEAERNNQACRCECEHVSHESPCLGLVTHDHKTIYGTFLVCQTCHDAGHMPIKAGKGTR